MPISVVLPAPFGPEQREEIALLHVEIDALQGLHAVLVGLDESADRERIHRARKGSTEVTIAAHGSPERRELAAWSAGGLEQARRVRLKQLRSAP